jgi:hypothetical protein
MIDTASFEMPVPVSTPAMIFGTSSLARLRRLSSRRQM